MKNTENYTLKPTIMMTLDDFNALIEKLSNNEFTTEIDYEEDTDLKIISRGNQREDDNEEDEDFEFLSYHAEDGKYGKILKLLSSHFGVNVTSFHIDTFDPTGVWIVYREKFDTSYHPTR